MFRLLLILSVLFAIFALFFYIAQKDKKNIVYALAGMLLSGAAAVYFFMHDERPALSQSAHTFISLKVTERSVTPNGIRLAGYITNDSDEAASLLVFQPVLEYCPKPTENMASACRILDTSVIRLHGHFTSTRKTNFTSFIELSGHTDMSESEYNLSFTLQEAYGYD